MHDLALEIGCLDPVVVDDRQGADSGCGEGEHDGGSESARADHSHVRGGEPALRDLAEPRQHAVSRGAGALVVAQLREGLDERGKAMPSG
nr:hypothetical protein GCM10025699_00870 [Microbacterium flavescens]